MKSSFISSSIFGDCEEEADDAFVQVPREVDHLHGGDELLAELRRDDGLEVLLLRAAELLELALGQEVALRGAEGGLEEGRGDAPAIQPEAEVQVLVEEDLLARELEVEGVVDAHPADAVVELLRRIERPERTQAQRLEEAAAKRAWQLAPHVELAEGDRSAERAHAASV
ncbi:MAG: hypothetical protein M5U28_50780 [Sandaracinaceae bacterium]|nr:hypothetical protein [Sandaracinaceae bacterium]